MLQKNVILSYFNEAGQLMGYQGKGRSKGGMLSSLEFFTVYFNDSMYIASWIVISNEFH